MVGIQQQIYASLDLDGVRPGHHTHVCTDGLGADELERYEGICNRWGVYEPGADFQRAVVQTPLWEEAPPPAPPSHHLVALISYQGRDAGGRQGALLRHIVRIPADEYERMGFNPFHLQRHVELLDAWTPATPFPDVEIVSDATREADVSGIFPERYPLLRVLLAHLLGAGRLAMPTAGDSPAVEETMSQLMELLPVSVRRTLSLATFCYQHPEDYALVARRAEEGSFRHSLEALKANQVPSLDELSRSYLDELFARLEARDWSSAIRAIEESELGERRLNHSRYAVRETEDSSNSSGGTSRTGSHRIVPAQRPSADQIAPTGDRKMPGANEAPNPSNASPAAAAERPAAGSPVDGRGPVVEPPPPAPPLRRSAPEEKDRSGRRWPWVLFLLVVVAVAAVLYLRWCGEDRYGSLPLVDGGANATTHGGTTCSPTEV